MHVPYIDSLVIHDHRFSEVLGDMEACMNGVLEENHCDESELLDGFVSEYGDICHKTGSLQFFKTRESKTTKTHI